MKAVQAITDICQVVCQSCSLSSNALKPVLIHRVNVLLETVSIGRICPGIVLIIRMGGASRIVFIDRMSGALEIVFFGQTGGPLGIVIIGWMSKILIIVFVGRMSGAI